MGLQHLADGNRRRAVRSISKALFFCHMNGLKWELVRAADDLQVWIRFVSAHDAPARADA